ncbi:MAG TPA: choice-of-anchor tandem repeat NxxGxxAF-containing protein [Ideonella sp.]|uniref:choice-of-anchor tandem repeat NxxGxxAF-containing protein n=1 Tax=Ideonella sp. TaxID=1929293 RepID=UPI002E3172BC|nr:choice-of-anchor tandem repeat NxxGxxAF-containing protein [Ideonella sp.]HEX5684796.1 choice-of-anchor tandem repeat NxxGxxAF-containing protein [Ideonella sp.]
MTLQFRPYTWTRIATNDGRFNDFAPYVAAINDDGVVAFQATLSDGHSGVFTSDGTFITEVAVTASTACPARLFSSHPDINQAGKLAVYATLKSGEAAVLLMRPDGSLAATDGLDWFNEIGPMGPTMNEHDDVAVRGTSQDGRACIRVWRGTQFQAIAEAGDRFSRFEGLPVVNNDGHVAFRADLPDGRQGIFVHRDDQCAAIALTGNDFVAIARFPIINDRADVAFAARRASGVWGIFTAASGRLACVVDAEAGFESFRGVLINNAGPVAFYGTPAGGQLGIYTGIDPIRHRILGLGDTVFGATVVDFALNPVSINGLGQLAIRVALDDRRQFILRGDPVV